jgi:hypothetical protein
MATAAPQLTVILTNAPPSLALKQNKSLAPAMTYVPTNNWPALKPGSPLAPGIYATAPYSMVVVVPGPTRDDKAVKDPGPVVPPMPTVRPELRFIPRK